MGEAWRPEAGGSGGAGMLGAEGSITIMMAELYLRLLGRLGPLWTKD